MLLNLSQGAKLCMVLELLGNSGSVTGVDVAKHRLAACRTLVQKYKLGDYCRLFVADGASFSLIPICVHYGFKSGKFLPKEAYYIGIETNVHKFLLFLVNRKFGVEKDEFLYKEWTSRRPWKERKRANKEIKNGFSELIQDPELIYYGRCSGVVGMSKIELFKTVSSHEISQYGYDKVY